MTELARFQGVPHGLEGEACLGALDPSKSSTDKEGKKMSELRTCKDCGTTKPLEDYPHRKGYALSRCKACQRIFRRRYTGINRSRAQCVGEISAAPLVEWLQGLVKQLGGPGPVAAKVGLNERALWRLLHGQLFVQETLADRVFCEAGQPQLFYILYGDLYEDQDQETAA